MSEPLNWHTSTYTKSDSCVEVADNDPTTIHVRDSKRRSGPEVTWSPNAWGAFIELVAKVGV
ncbi:DUF397 domain-containing protein [Streptomyces narbonensis]|uniref:DUF397 domain-containing protein n=1 Tax=Streptomyces narbonensis TaxID=67333 RepID=UPI0033EFA5A1